jgi:hypothetical protein
MSSSWSESNRLHSSNMREEAAADAISEFDMGTEPDESEIYLPQDFSHDNLSAEDFEEMRQLARLDAIQDGDLDFDAQFDGAFDDYAEDRYLDASYEDRYDIDMPDFF